MIKRVSGKEMKDEKMGLVFGGGPTTTTPTTNEEIICMLYCNSRCGINPKSYSAQASGQTIYQN